jgi:hypothetical protein
VPALREIRDDIPAESAGPADDCDSHDRYDGVGPRAVTSRVARFALPVMVAARGRASGCENQPVPGKWTLILATTGGADAGHRGAASRY